MLMRFKEAPAGKLSGRQRDLRIRESKILHSALHIGQIRWSWRPRTSYGKANSTGISLSLTLEDGCQAEKYCRVSEGGNAFMPHLRRLLIIAIRHGGRRFGVPWMVV